MFAGMHERSPWILGPAVLLVSLFAGARSQVPPPEAPPRSRPDPGGWVNLDCSNPGTQQDTAKTPSIRNTTAAAIPRGRSVLWKASDGDHGGVTLGQDLSPGDSVRGTGKPARGVYTCSASFHAGMPDLVVLEASVDAAPSAVVQNTNPWLDAGATRARFELLRCSDDNVLAAKNVGPLQVAAGGKQTFTADIAKPWKSPPAYFRISADFDRRVTESNERNNVWSNRSACPGRTQSTKQPAPEPRRP
jgi:hypothetical protein